MIRRLPSAWSEAVLVCGKCSKKLDGGFGPKGRTGLAKALRKSSGLGQSRTARVGIVETKCLGVCARSARWRWRARGRGWWCQPGPA